jgi:hypothetical protein
MDDCHFGYITNNNNNNIIIININNIFSPQKRMAPYMPKVAPSIPQMNGSHPFLKPQLH